MTTKGDLPKLFHFEPATPRVISFGTNPSLAYSDYDEGIAISVDLLDPKRLKPTGHTLLLGIKPEEALGLARAIEALARKRGWREPDGEVRDSADGA